ncbi:hypothetical protein TVAG_266380 [Trichomonas vaginalis G3]|uniref:Glycosyltransferase 61 catalytic domain-containing protein n=1 Tax=Trichomonas vaginalis (strain ATCC PRA-98 / G3) TaxID=412133 RepID=A2DQJ1_TRIV3|nr:glycosyltransferase family [Trichomonas vaginalis G3]EAY17275.1 hypothetical protein TVAG_266380 [Trichomonas vaginalis G3]KAI5523267.1 glycosyltransferase family [Trichomonas vaginalis G3]|eukprot:XP_001329498.1 hypothetical protein [Trichomonas vaginalis G3]
MNLFIHNIIEGRESFIEQAHHFHGNWVHAKKMYASYEYAISDGVTVYEAGDMNNFRNIFKYHPGRVVGAYDNVIVLGHVGVGLFGHFMNEVLTQLVLFPEEIQRKSYIIVKGNRSMWEGIMTVLGFEGRTIVLQPKQWIYCENLYTVVEPRPHGGYYGPAIDNLHTVLRKAFNISHIIPTKIEFLNRKGPLRVVENYGELIEATKKEIS